MKVIFIILFALIPSITTLRCYVCNSLDNKSCNDGSDLTKFEQTCPQVVDPYCRKIDQIVNGDKSVVRSCGSKTGAKSCYKTAGTNNANVCSCNTDRCNHAASFNRQQQQIMTILSSIVALAISMIVLR